MTILLNNVDVNTVSTEKYKGDGSSAIAFVRGDDFGGGQVEISMSPTNDPRFTGMNNGVFTQDDQVRIDYVPPGAEIRAELSGSTGASNVFVEIR